MGGRLGLVEMLLFFGVVLAWAFWQWWDWRCWKRRQQDPARGHGDERE